MVASVVVGAIQDSEVVVVGAGPAGCSVAMRLAGAGISTVVVESPEAAVWRVGETVPPGVRPLLQGLGVWDEFRAGGHLAAAGNRSAWGSPEPAERDFIFDPDGPGWQLDRLRFDRMLAAAARRAGARWQTGRVVGMRRSTAGGWVLDLGAAERCATLRASVVVDATGRSSWVGRACGVRRRVVDRLVGVVAVVRPPSGGGCGDDEADPRTLVEAVETGWWYSVLVPGRNLVVAHMSDADLLATGPASGDHGWAELLDHAPLTRGRLGGCTPCLVARPRTVAAGSSVLARVGGDGWLAVGDAAATHDPLSSQGIATALAQGQWAATAAASALGGDSGAIDRYATDVITGYARYLAMRAGYYDLEQRWPDSPFWRRRQRRRENARRPASGALTGGQR